MKNIEKLQLFNALFEARGIREGVIFDEVLSCAALLMKESDAYQNITSRRLNNLALLLEAQAERNFCLAKELRSL